MASEREYGQELWRRFYLAGGYGDYYVAWGKFAAAHPDVAIAMAGGSAIATLRSEFRAADRDEHGDAPPFEPPHLREGFLDLFGIDLPPLTASIDGGIQGRIRAEDATPEQHYEANAQIREYHRRGMAYRDGNLKKWDVVRETVTQKQWRQALLDLVAVKV